MNQNYHEREEIWPLASEVRGRTGQVLPRSGAQVAEHKDEAEGNMQVLSSGTLPKFACPWIGSFVLASWELPAPAFCCHDRERAFGQHITEPKCSHRRHAKRPSPPLSSRGVPLSPLSWRIQTLTWELISRGETISQLFFQHDAGSPQHLRAASAREGGPR